MTQIGNIHLFNEDCMEVMARYPDGYFDLAVVDPQYGINQPAFRKESKNKAAKTKDYNNSVYKQTPPSPHYFIELERVSKNQIIWGGNYFCENLRSGNQWIFWDKGTEFTQWGDGELAYTSFDGAIVKYSYRWNGMLQQDMKNKEIRIHPTQKPVALYDWIYHKYASPGQKILDTHLGSGSNAIAAHYFGVSEFVGCEIVKEYFDASVKRIKEQTRQLKLI